MDEVPLMFDVPLNKTVDVKGAKTRLLVMRRQVTLLFLRAVLMAQSFHLY